MSHKVADVIAVMERRYPSASAEEWDAVGLVTGNPDQEVRKVLFAVDPTEAVVAEAIEIQAQMIIAHHPLILKGVSSVSEATRKGNIISQLIKANISLFTAHTNADIASPGVSDALAKSIGVEVTGPIDMLSKLGRIGQLVNRMPLSDFAKQVESGLPKTARGIHVAGDLNKSVHRIAVCGGAGDSLLELVAQSAVDVFVTSDLKYHVAEEFVRSTEIALIDISHWAGEWTWLDQGATRLATDLGGNLETKVSSIITDPWTLTLN